MIIDCILDRYDGVAYDPYDFMNAMRGYRGIGVDIADELNFAFVRAYRGESNPDSNVKKALKKYVINNGYNLAICDFIDSADWVNPDDGKDYSKIIDIFANKPIDYDDYNNRLKKYNSELTESITKGKASKKDRENMLLSAGVIVDKADYLIRECRTFDKICKDTINSYDYEECLGCVLTALDSISDYVDDLYNQIDRILNK